MFCSWGTHWAEFAEQRMCRGQGSEREAEFSLGTRGLHTLAGRRYHTISLPREHLDFLHTIYHTYRSSFGYGNDDSHCSRNSCWFPSRAGSG